MYLNIPRFSLMITAIRVANFLLMNHANQGTTTAPIEHISHHSIRALNGGGHNSFNAGKKQHRPRDRAVKPTPPMTKRFRFRVILEALV
jgi:hypothetical protein